MMQIKPVLTRRLARVPTRRNHLVEKNSREIML